MVMVFGANRLIQGSKWLTIGMMGMIMLASVTSEDETGTPSAGSLCISDCATCPLICSPPPPQPLKSFSPPSPSVHRSPPTVPFYYTPPQSDSHSNCPSPLESESLPSPPPLVSVTLPLPPPLESLSPPSPPRPPPTPPAPSSKASPPPPRFVYFSDAPPAPQGPPKVVGPIQYPYPYYNYYTSKASSVSFQASLSLVMFSCFSAMALLLHC